MKEKYDVIVCGGGFAGCAAAIAAARGGASVLLIEKSGFLSGAAGNCNINPFMPFSTKINGKSVNLSAGIFEEITAELARLNGFRNKDGAIFSNELLKLVLDRMMIKSGADVLFHTYIATADDIKACTKFGDGIAACNYDIDIHDPTGGGTSHYYFKEGTYYTIPYRCLLPQGTDNLLVAGRCISGTHEAQASFRIMPVCCTLGEAAGTAAAIAKEDNCRVDEVDINKLKNTLKKNGAFI